ncbi:hypothetical protein C8Q79DRAFT_930407 [Trametes meyenii]|nr:hypothetical protein C8Q79DRAFT_930407 [Trametes meyenii]
MPLALPMDIMRLPVYVELAARTKEGLPKHVLLTVVLRALEDANLQAEVEVDLVASEESYDVPLTAIVHASNIPSYVDVFYPRNVLENPIYIVVHDPPNLTFPHRLRITLCVREYNPGDASTFAVHVKLQWMDPARTVSSTTLPFDAAQPFGPWAADALIARDIGVELEMGGTPASEHD